VNVCVVICLLVSVSFVCMTVSGYAVRVCVKVCICVYV
jgi:hypothetical protein